jgi:MFS family permease
VGVVTTYGQLLALRFCLGMFESGLFPGLNFFLTGWYKREELNRRVSIFFAGAVLAGAFGGIFGYAWSRMDGVGGKQGWSWIFIMEGLLSKNSILSELNLLTLQRSSLPSRPSGWFMTGLTKPGSSPLSSASSSFSASRPTRV